MIARCGSWRFWMVAGLALAVSACRTAGPDYQRPMVNVPEVFRGGPESAAAPSLGEAKWWEVFQDQQLFDLIHRSLTQNYDVQLAAARIIEAEALVGITRADALPAVAVGPSLLGQRTPAASFGSSRNVAGFLLQATAAWQLDFWGKYRRATEAARAELVASDWGKRAVVATLVSAIADAYFSLRALDLELDVSRRTLESREESLRITQVREQGGATSLVDVRQAEQLVYAAKAQIVSLERSIEQQENLLHLLAGELPGPIVRGHPLEQQSQPAEVPAGLPSELLERRPDIQQAELRLVAANAQIGVAKAAFFPQISLTGSGGFESTALLSLFTGGAAIGQVAFGALQPVFTGGRLRAELQAAEARKLEAQLVYQQTILQAFRDVSDALVGYRKSREFRAQQQLLLTSAQDARRLADVRYQGGVTSYLEVLDADTRLFTAELDLVQAQLSELGGVVDIYRALGGGWQE
jgi:multidrug efflux system outer membrane protein